MPEFADEEFARPVITRLEQARLAAAEDRIEAELMLGRHSELAGELDALVQEHPLRERLWGQLMVALYRSGRQGDALRAYQRARVVLADELGVDPGSELKALETRCSARTRSRPARHPQAAGGESADRTGNLPAAPSALIGRRDELDTVAAALRGSRLVTVVGPGGVGKTRLAIELARSLLSGYRDGAWLVELAPVADGSAVAAAVGDRAWRGARTRTRLPPPTCCSAWVSFCPAGRRCWSWTTASMSPVGRRGSSTTCWPAAQTSGSWPPAARA